jgi:hypothetical protein
MLSFVPHLLIVLALAAGWLLLCMFKPARPCRKCSALGHRKRKACPRCKGTGRQFRLGAPFAHRLKLMTFAAVRDRIEHARERREME